MRVQDKKQGKKETSVTICYSNDEADEDILKKNCNLFFCVVAVAVAVAVVGA